MSIRNKIVAATVAGMMAIATPLIKMEEGFSSVAYPDIGGVWTWCYGETEGPRPTQPMSEPECSFMLKAKIYTIGLAVWALVKTPMSNERWAALTSFVYNVGINAFRGSTLLKMLNDDHPKACDQLRRWTFVGKKDCSIKANGCMGLYNRREKERRLCLQ